MPRLKIKKRKFASGKSKRFISWHLQQNRKKRVGAKGGLVWVDGEGWIDSEVWVD